MRGSRERAVHGGALQQWGSTSQDRRSLERTQRVVPQVSQCELLMAGRQETSPAYLESSQPQQIHVAVATWCISLLHLDSMAPPSGTLPSQSSTSRWAAMTSLGCGEIASSSLMTSVIQQFVAGLLSVPHQRPYCSHSAHCSRSCGLLGWHPRCSCGESLLWECKGG
jgi:hypothetical protein